MVFNTQKLNCTICCYDIRDFYNTSTKILELNRKIITTPAATKALSQGRIVVVNSVVCMFCHIAFDVNSINYIT